MEINIDAIKERCIRRGLELDAKIKALHGRACQTWETWTEKNAKLMEGGRADITFDGCRKCQVAIAHVK
jgi:hypothetical protein